ncbi:MAG: diguanylate cyclase [Clostridiales bacterium]|nr:diguanylate cyclase [Clostridiales bacterium]
MEGNRQKRIFEILSVVKLFTVLIIGIAGLNEYTKSNNAQFSSEIFYYDIFSLSIFLFIMLFSCWLWLGYTSLENAQKYRNILYTVEILINLLAITILVAYSPEIAQYKLLFLLVIITTIIQYGFKYGMLISLLSSGIIITIDLISIGNTIMNDTFQNDLIVLGIFNLLAWLLGYYEKIEREHREYITQLTITDGLTEVYNHRHFYDSMKVILQRAKHAGEPVSLLFIDIDNFKHYNDLFGHQKGDTVLKGIAQIIKENVRSHDLVFRYGGEEFSVILQDVCEQVALVIAERIRKTIEETKFEGEEYMQSNSLTVSIGVSSFPEKAQNDTDLVKCADDALYRAKFFNKNRVETYFSILQELKDDIKEKDVSLITSIMTLISVINAKDRYTYGHTERVVMLTQMLGDGLGLSDEDKKTLQYGAYLHDIGKINIPEEVLNKKMPLTPEEWEILKQHSSNGVGIISPVECLEHVKPVILHHHERYDGKGYPHGLKGQEIPYLARVMTVVDSFDAMSSNRTYRARKSFDDAIEEIRRCSGTQFDPEIAEVFINILLKSKGKFY